MRAIVAKNTDALRRDLNLVTLRSDAEVVLNLSPVPPVNRDRAYAFFKEKLIYDLKNKLDSFLDRKILELPKPIKKADWTQLSFI